MSRHKPSPRSFDFKKEQKPYLEDLNTINEKLANPKKSCPTDGVWGSIAEMSTEIAHLKKKVNIQADWIMVLENELKGGEE